MASIQTCKRACKQSAKMMNHGTSLIVVLACIAAAGGWWLEHHQLEPALPESTVSSPTKVYTQGEQVGNYTLPNLAGKTTRLAQWHGKAVILNFWATWCAPCRAEMPMLAQTQRKYRKDGLQVVGITMAQPQATMSFLNALDIRYPTLIGIDASPAPTTAFGDTAGLLPYSVLVDRSGHVMATKLGPLDASTIRDWLAQAKVRH